MKRLVFLILVSLSLLQAQDNLKKEVIDYKHGEVQLQGYLVYNNLLKAKRPGILVVHEWWGHNDYARSRAEELAEMGYIAFAVDMYGKGVSAKTAEEAGKLAGAFYQDRQLMRDRAKAALEILNKQRNVDPARLAAIGFCFGGTVALELARSGADLKAVVSFHGGLSTPNPDDAKNIKARVLALHGADDPYIPAEDVTGFQNEMRNGGVDWQMIFYGNTVHSFSNPAAGHDKSTGAAYNRDSAIRAWGAMDIFFKEILR